MDFIIDRIAEQVVVLENEKGERLEVPAALLPVGAREGDVITVTLNSEKRSAREKAVNELMNNLFCD